MGKDLRMIYVRIDGRIGNQLFMYAFAKSVSNELNDKNILIDDTEASKKNYKDCLMEYNFLNVKFVHTHKMLYKSPFIIKNFIFNLYRIVRKRMNYNQRFELEKKWQTFFNKNGLILIENGYLPHNVYGCRNVFINGYFQSAKFFEDIQEEVKKDLFIEEALYSDYPGLEEIKNKNSVCISIKVQHNVGNSMYDVCNDGYWQRAIEYICQKVENPLFFICSDNVEYVKEMLIDCDKYEAIFQDSNYPEHISLTVMSKCKHFIIGNTSFGWWAQYLSNNTEKIVIAPKKWMAIDMPIDIYQDGWHLVEVD